MISVAAQSWKVELTTSKAEVKCSIEEGITRGEHLRCANERKGPGESLRTAKGEGEEKYNAQRSEKRQHRHWEK